MAAPAPGRIRPSIIPDHFAGLPVLLSAEAVAWEFPGAQPRCSVSVAMSGAVVAMPAHELRGAIMAPAEQALEHTVRSHAAACRPVAVTFLVGPSSVQIQAWCVPVVATEAA